VRVSAMSLPQHAAPLMATTGTEGNTHDHTTTAFTGLEYRTIASRVGAESGHRPQVAPPAVRGGQCLDAVGECGQEFVLPGAALLGGQSWGSTSAG
jgi:hypothetical protein